MKKYYWLALIPVLLLVYFWLFSKAFTLISAPSDLSVVAGVVLLAACIFTILKLIFYVGRKF